MVEAHNKRFIASQVRDPELRRKLTPDYSFGCKRPSVSNKYLRTFNRDNVDLVTDPIARVTAAGIETADGREREVDVLILATGFRLASDPENYRRSPVRGTNGFDLATHYERNRLKAYESISMPGLPNHFIIFGPYGFTGGSWFTLVEITSRHIVRVHQASAGGGAPRGWRSRPEAHRSLPRDGRTAHAGLASGSTPTARGRTATTTTTTATPHTCARHPSAAGAAGQQGLPARRLRVRGG